MRRSLGRILLLSAFLAAFGAAARALPADPEATFEKGKQAYLKQNYHEAEKQFRACVKAKPDSWSAHFYLAHSLYYLGKYPAAISEYEKARDLGTKSGEMGQPDERLLNVQVGMAYGNGGQPLKAREIFEAAIKKDPHYSIYYYNLACTHAETGDLEMALAILKKANASKEGLASFETFPNPRKDASFKKYLGDPRFETAMKEMGY